MVDQGYFRSGIFSPKRYLSFLNNGVKWRRIKENSLKVSLMGCQVREAPSVISICTSFREKSLNHNFIPIGYWRYLT